MRFLGIIASLFLMSSCSTTIRDKNGIVRYRSFSNMKNWTYQDEATSIHADDVDNSAPTRAAGSVVGTTLSGMAAAGIGGAR